MALCCVALSWAGGAYAYRPFDGTDAEVVEPKVFEVEIGPAHYFQRASQSYLITPAVVLNLGIIERLELVVDASNLVAIGKLSPDVSRVSLLSDDVLLKYMLREGTLQEKGGASVATEGGVLTPEVNGTSDFGATLGLIVSDRSTWGTMHWNERLDFNREHHVDLFSSLIVEGPHDWRIRPVAEIFYDKDFVTDRMVSGLMGAIWTVNDSVSLDVGLRAARNGDANEEEARLGLTWTIPLGHDEKQDPGAGARGLWPATTRSNR